MIEHWIAGMTKESEFENDMYYEILEITNQVERQQAIEALRKKARAVSRLTEFNNLLKSHIQAYAQELKKDNTNTTQFTDAPMTLNCGRYIADDTGICLKDMTKDGIDIVLPVCPHPLLATERYVNIDTDTEKTRIAFFKDAKWRSMVIENGVLSNKSKIVDLADRGIMVTSENAKDLVKYINELLSLNMQEIPLYRSTSRLGWIDGDFAPYKEEVKYDGDSTFQSIYDCVKEQGDFDIWKEHINELREYKELKIMLATSFASVLIEKVGTLPFVLHLWGETGFGKTVSLMVAASIWGDPEQGKLTRTMNMTANSMARTASFLYSLPFCADELQQIKDRWGNYDKLIMFLCEGIDRGRAKAYGGVEQLATWRNAFIFTGEEPVTKANSGGGVKNRCIEVEVKEKVIEDGNRTATIMRENYGHAGKLFIDFLQTKSDASIQREYKEIFNEIMESTDTTEKQAYSMALIVLADRYACECVYDDNRALKVKEVKEYLHSAKSVDMAQRAWEWTCSWIAENTNNFIESSQAIMPSVIYGKKDKNTFYILKEVLVREMIKNSFDFEACKKKWESLGRLKKNSQGKFFNLARINGIQQKTIKLVFSDEEETDGFMQPTDEEMQNLPFK